MCLSAHRYGSYVCLACHLLLADSLTPFLCLFSFSPFFFSSWHTIFLVWESPSNTVGSWQSWWIQQAAVRPVSFIARVFLSLHLCCFYPFLSASSFLSTWFSLSNKITLFWLLHTRIYPASLKELFTKKCLFTDMEQTSRSFWLSILTTKRQKSTTYCLLYIQVLWSRFCEEQTKMYQYLLSDCCEIWYRWILSVNVVLSCGLYFTWTTFL